MEKVGKYQIKNNFFGKKKFINKETTNNREYLSAEF